MLNKISFDSNLGYFVFSLDEDIFFSKPIIVHRLLVEDNDMDLGKDKEEQMFQINVSKKGIKYNIVCTCRLLHLDIELGFFKMHQ